MTLQVKIAERTQVVIVYGWPELTDEGVYNSVQLVDAGDAVAARYRKVHLYGDFDQEDAGCSSLESKIGQSAVVA